MTPLTKNGADVFAPTNAAGEARAVDNGEAQVWATEMEAAITQVEVAITGIEADVAADIAALQGSLDAIEIAADSITKATWAELNAITGTRDGQRGYVEDDAGTHTDPVVGGTVGNQGVYAWVSGSPSGWQWMREDDFAVLDARTDALDATDDGKFTIRDEEGYVGVQYDPARGLGVPGGTWFSADGGVTAVQNSEGVAVAKFLPDGVEVAGAASYKDTADATFRIRDEEGFIVLAIGQDGVPEPGQGGTETVAATAQGIVAGALTDTSFDVVADVDGSASAISKLVVSTDEYFTNRVYVSPLETPDVTPRSPIANWRTLYFSATGLSADTDYWYAISIDGAFDVSTARTIHTLPAEGVSAAFKFVFGSCNYIAETTPLPAMVAMQAEVAAGARFLLHLGDIAYSDIAVDDIAAARARNARLYRSNTDADALNAVAPLVYMPSDHDIADNDPHWDKTYTGTTFEQIVANSRKAYRETVPHYPFVQRTLGETDPDKIILTQQFDVAKTRFLLLDCYSQTRYESGTPTVLGNATNPPGAWDQLAWLLDAIADAATDTVDHLFIVISRGWTPAIEASWEEIAPDERQDIVDQIIVNGPAKTTIIGADFHFCAVDDGTNAGVPLAIASPFRQDTVGNQSGLQTGFEWNTAGSALVGNADAYALMEVESNGNWTVTFKGAPYTDGVPTTLATYSYADL